jgi:hypothetical protein
VVLALASPSPSHVCGAYTRSPAVRRVLGLGNNCFSVDGVSKLVSALDVNRSLTELFLGDPTTWLVIILPHVFLYHELYLPPESSFCGVQVWWYGERSSTIGSAGKDEMPAK